MEELTMSFYHQPYPQSPLADIVVLIAGDTSMTDLVTALQAAGAPAVSAASNKCPSDVDVSFFSLGTDSFQHFYPSPTLKTYLSSLTAPTNLKERDAGTAPADGNYDLENGTIDASQYFDWRTGAKKAVLLIGNAWPDGGGLKNPGTSNSAAAISAAQGHQVTVFTCLTPPKAPNTLDPTVAQEYQALASGTGGKFFDMSSGAPTASDGITTILQTIICALAPATSTQTGGSGSCSSVCDSFSSVLCVINLLACALNKAMDSCCPNAGANTGCDCGCGDKTPPPPPLWGSARAGQLSSIPNLMNSLPPALTSHRSAPAQSAPAKQPEHA